MIYDIHGDSLSSVFDVRGSTLYKAYNIDGKSIFTPAGLDFDSLEAEYFVTADVSEQITAQTYMGGYIEIQPDSWDGNTPSVDDSSNKWGFPMSLSEENRAAIKSEIFSGNGRGVMYVRFPLGFAYRGYRNIDEETGLAKNIGERWSGQNEALQSWFSGISEAGGGIAPEYWCPPVYWLTSGAYNGNNQIWAGGSYSRSTTLASIKESDPEQYALQIEAFTDAIVDDFEYLHQNIAPVRMLGLQNEPQYARMEYGACKYDAQTYNDVLEVLYPKVRASTILSNYNGMQNDILLHVASSDESAPFTGIANTYIQKHADDIWGYSHHSMRYASGESYSDGADWYKTAAFQTIKGAKDNVFINEYEYFNTSFGTDGFRCSNNMLHLINELVYGGAKVLHPVIHVCKPTGQSLASTNTSGYCLYAVNVDDGSYEVNTWAYNSWKMFNDNLPVGATLVGDYSEVIRRSGWAAFTHNGKMILFMATSGAVPREFTLTFDTEKTFVGKAYSMDYLGAEMQPKSGKTITFKLPAETGICWIEQ